MIRCLKRNEIDDGRWDACVKGAVNSLPYGYTWYLDCATDQWDGLVYNDYEAVLPLVWHRRFFISYLYQPMFTQQLGVFSVSGLNENILKSFLDSIPSKFCFIEINLNHGNPVSHERFDITRRMNLCIELSPSYETLYGRYHENVKRNLQKAEKHHLHIQADFKPEIVSEFFKTNTGIKIPELGEYHYEHLHALMEEAMKRGMGKTLGVLDEKDNLFAAGFFLTTEKRIINLLPSTDIEGKEIGAGFYLVDYIIRENARTQKVLDFEGSMIESIARFYKSFGAQEQSYWRLRRNDLPWVLRWVKG